VEKGRGWEEREGGGRRERGGGVVLKFEFKSPSTK
jgi:hypothetical protein